MNRTLVPHDLATALRMVAEHPELTVVAGGTDVMVPVNAGTVQPTGWISLRRLAALQVIDGTRLGAGATFARIGVALATAAPSLAHAARTVGGPQIRNAATIGGNLATASPAGDSLPALLCCDATVELTSVTGVRSLAIEDYLVGPKRTARRPDELLTAVHLVHSTGAQAFASVGRRPAMAISMCSLAMRLDVDRGEARIAIGAAAPTAIRARRAEELLLDGADAHDVADAVMDAAAPIDDHRATAAYRRHALGVLTRRMHGWMYAR